jgi:membrane protease YdiL (CAAX protease family)
MPAEGISLRVAVYGLVSPVILSLALMAIWPERYGEPGEITMSSARLGGTLAAELLLAATVGTWLWRQGWRPHRTATLAFVPRDVLRALGVWLLALAVYWGWAVACHYLVPELTAAALSTQVHGRPSLGVVVALSLANAVFEEFLWLGLGVAALRRCGLGVASLISIGLRTLMHAYQGPLALVAILPLGIVFTAYYVRTRRLWPVVLAHAFQDLLVLGSLAVRASGGGAV